MVTQPRVVVFPGAVLYTCISLALADGHVALSLDAIFGNISIEPAGLGPSASVFRLIVLASLVFNRLTTKWTDILLAPVLKDGHWCWLLHILKSSFYRNNEYIRVLCTVGDFLQIFCVISDQFLRGTYIKEHLVAIKMKLLLSKEPSSMHIKSPGCSVALLKSEFIFLSIINSHEVLHQHIINMLFCLVPHAKKKESACMENNLEDNLHNTSIEHTANISTRGTLRV